MKCVTSLSCVLCVRYSPIIHNVHQFTILYSASFAVQQILDVLLSLAYLRSLTFASTALFTVFAKHYLSRYLTVKTYTTTQLALSVNCLV